MSVIVLHHLGAAEAAAGWRAALAAEGVADVWAPDLPGHAGAATPIGGNYTRVDPVYEIGRRVADGFDLSDTVLVGVGLSGWAAMVLAAAGEGRGLVLVDGLGTPWRSQADVRARWRAAIRATSVSAESMGPAPEHGVDPRIAVGLVAHGDEELVRDAAEAITIPTLLIGTDHEAATSLQPSFSGAVTVVESAPTAEAVAPQLAGWLRQL